MKKNNKEMNREEFEQKLHQVDVNEDIKNASWIVYGVSYAGLLGLCVANKVGSKAAKITTGVAIGASMVAGTAQAMIQHNYKACRKNMAYAEANEAVQREGIKELFKDKVNKEHNKKEV